jgi:hypothetical protein
MLIKSVPCHHGMARPRVADEEDGLQIWRVVRDVFSGHRSQPIGGDLQVGGIW